MKYGLPGEGHVFNRSVELPTTCSLLILGLLAALTYVATKGASDGILISIWLFAFGTFCSVLHATLDYYLTEISFSAYRRDVASLYEHKLDWEVFVDRNEHRPPADWLLHLVGWLGGLAFFVGLVYGLQQIPNT
ncbi:hypothetical protein F8A86_03130 [Betaproteobacteria bacterium SCN1]|jgi:drug/metabolite transporter (DMT)-like permease|nr:hypothetical protein F8A86_03130 [Betaproteobacteria bacterium SCN1]